MDGMIEPVAKKRPMRIIPAKKADITLGIPSDQCASANIRDERPMMMSLFLE